MITLSEKEFIEMEKEIQRHDTIRIVLMLLLLTACLVVVACQSANAPQSQSPVQLGAVLAEGTCKGSLDLDLNVGGLALPIAADVDTHASAEGATGIVSLDIGGLLQARCEVFKGVGDCKVSGLLAPRRSMPVTANPPPASEGGQPDVASPSP